MAGDRICVGKIDKVGLGRWGDSLYIYSNSLFGDGDGRKLCSLKLPEGETHYKYISPEICQNWLSLLLTSFMGGKGILFDYDSKNSTKTCHERESWANFNPPSQVVIKES